MAVTTTLTDPAPEEGTYGVQCDFTDEDGTAITPTSIVWSLTTRPSGRDSRPTVINSRDGVAVAVPDSSIDITLSGDDLAFQDGETHTKAERVLTVEYVFDSDLGTDLPGKAQCIFSVENIYYMS